MNDVLTVYDHQQQYYGFASTAVQTTLIHALLKAHSKAMPGNLLAYEAWVQLKTSGRHLDAQALLAGGCNSRGEVMKLGLCFAVYWQCTARVVTAAVTALLAAACRSPDRAGTANITAAAQLLSNSFLA